MKSAAGKYTLTRNLLLSLLTVAAMSSCRLRMEENAVRIRPLPSSYAGDRLQDSSGRVAGTWRTFFKDSLLAGLISEGLANNPDIFMSVQRTHAANADVLFAKGRILPSAGVHADYLQRKFGLYTMDGAGNISTDILPGQMVPIHLPDFYLGVQASWEADIWGKLHSKRKGAAARYLATVEGQRLLTTNLVAQIAHHYYALVFLDNELEVIRRTIQIQKEAVELVSFQKIAGTVTELAVKQFRTQLLAEQAMEFEVLQDIVSHENHLNFLLGRYSGSIPRNKELITDTFALIPGHGQPSDLLANRPDIRQAELEVTASHADLAAARAAFYPSLNFSGAMGLQAFHAGLLFQLPQSLAYSLFGGLAAPLLNRSAIQAKFGISKARQTEALYNYQKVLLNAWREVSTQMAAVQNYRNIVSLKTMQLEEASLSWEISSELFSTNRANYVEVLMAQRIALETNLLLLDARRKQYDASVDLYRALGGGWR